MGKFKDYVENVGIRGDYSHLSLNDRLAIGKDSGETFIRNQLAKYGVNITPAGAKADRHLKIDGYLNNEPVQIKLRRTSRDDRNDIAFEVVRNHDTTSKLLTQLQNPQQQGRDYKGAVMHYFVMNPAETEIYHVAAPKLKDAVNQAISELGRSYLNGILARPFKSSNGVELRPTRDNDPASFTPTKVMAFVPVQNVITKSYPVKDRRPTPPARTFGGGGNVQQPQRPLRGGIGSR